VLGPVVLLGQRGCGNQQHAQEKFIGRVWSCMETCLPGPSGIAHPHEIVTYSCISQIPKAVEQQAARHSRVCRAPGVRLPRHSRQLAPQWAASNNEPVAHLCRATGATAAAAGSSEWDITITRCRP
jgi:hypothetical protein